MDTYFFQSVNGGKMASFWEKDNYEHSALRTESHPPANLVQIGPPLKMSSSNGWRKSARAWSRSRRPKRETHHFKKPVEKPFTRNSAASPRCCSAA
jgi:hypothetical protein